MISRHYDFEILKLTEYFYIYLEICYFLKNFFLFKVLKEISFSLWNVFFGNYIMKIVF